MRPKQIAEAAKKTSHIKSVQEQNLFSMARNGHINPSPKSTYEKRFKRYLLNCFHQLERISDD